ncbi:MAG: sulfatase-like hydrolase/transferase [Cyclobacteriaceae bacterium]
MVSACQNKSSNQQKEEVKAVSEKPNIIVIFADDLGYADLGANGSVTDIKTPNLDELANTGVRMTSGYVTAPQCVPSRAGLLTGRYQERFGTDHNGTRPLPLNERTIADRMQTAGYTTGMAGKWHLEPLHVEADWIKEEMPELAASGNKPKMGDIPFERKIPYLSSRRGFQQVFDGRYNKYWATYNFQGEDIEEQFVEQEGYRLDVQTDATVAFIKKNKDNPFFFYLAYYAPHVPLEATENYLSRFPGDMPERRRYCLAMMSAIDDGVGKIKSTLRELGLEENTMIYFIGDNGAPLKIYKEDRTLEFKGGAWDGSLNDPFVGEKGMISEGGIRVPFIVNWPAGLPNGKVYDRPVISLDMAATSLAMAGLEQPGELDGVNLLPFLNGEKQGDPHNALYWRFWQQTAIREGDFKYLTAGDRKYLFNVATEEHETKNLLSQYPDKARDLRKKLESWASELKNPGIPSGELKREKKWFDHYFAFNE